MKRVNTKGIKISTFDRLKEGNKRVYARSYKRNTAFSSYCVSFSIEQRKGIGFEKIS